MSDAPTPGETPGDTMQTDILAWLGHAWGLFVAAPGPWVIGAVCTMVLGGLSLGLVAGPMLRGLFLMAARAEKGEALEPLDVFHGLKGGLPAAIVFIVTVVTAALASLIFVLPGVALAYLWIFALPAVSLSGAGVSAALVQSFRLATRRFEPTLLVALLVAGLSLVGGFLVLAWVVTLPLAVLLLGAAYLRLTAEA